MLFLVLFISQKTYSQQNDSTVSFLNKKNFKYILGAEAIIYGATIIGLNQLWYANYPQSSFHLIDDNNNWKQMDKIGHIGSAYYLGYLQIKLMKKCGYTSKKSMLLGGSTGFIFLTSIEILDGFSKAWGASMGDVLANTTGYLLLVGQELVWKEQRIMFKFSMSPSPYAKYRPDLLGYKINDQILKDYNAQTYWLSLNIGSFMKAHQKFPKWLNLAVGYGADGMTGGPANFAVDVYNIPIPPYYRTRQFYLSLDMDLHRIKTKKIWLNTLLQTIGFIKIPFPAVEYNDKYGFNFIPIMF
jgi:VanZ family protein